MHSSQSMGTHDLIVIGASAGGVEAISTIVSELPRDLRAAVLVVLHLARGRSLLPEILSRSGRLPAVHPNDGERLQYGRIYVAPPDHHMTLERDVIRVTHGPTENGVRPAIDPLFRSAGRAFRTRVIGVVATGALDDGTAGLAAIKQAGGVAIVQDPDEAVAPSMPRSAIAAVNVDHVVPLREIAPLLTALTRESAPADQRRMGGHLQPMEPDRGAQPIALNERDRPGQLAVFTCPECSGNLWEHEDNGILRFRCRVGHVYSPDSMFAAQTDSVDRALWTALRALEERAAFTRRLAQRARDRNHTWVAGAFEQRANDAAEQAALVSQLLVDRSSGHVVPESDTDGPDVDAEIQTATTVTDEE
jgi:two-component system, chemotaxis family, protein-glutamate methylesterase/glutaminase